MNPSKEYDHIVFSIITDLQSNKRAFFEFKFEVHSKLS
jgi:hypothetical protein